MQEGAGAWGAAGPHLNCSLRLPSPSSSARTTTTATKATCGQQMFKNKSSRCSMLHSSSPSSPSPSLLLLLLFFFVLELSLMTRSEKRLKIFVWHRVLTLWPSWIHRVSPVCGGEDGGRGGGGGGGTDMAPQLQTPLHALQYAAGVVVVVAAWRGSVNVLRNAICICRCSSLYNLIPIRVKSES